MNTKIKMIISIILILVCTRTFAATEFNMTFQTAAPGGQYNPLNVVVVWVTTSSGTFVKTILRYAKDKKGELTTWSTAGGSAENSTTVGVDGYMGATRSNHSSPLTMNATWDLKNKSGVVVPDGNYLIKFECADGSRQVHSFTFLKDSVAGTRNPAGTTWFKNISIAYVPPAPPNTAPVAQAQSVTNAEDTAKAITLTATDAESNPLTYAIVASPTHGALSGTPPSVTYTPATNYYGTDSFTFRASDASLTSTPATVSITVTPVNDPPVAQAQSPTATDGNALPLTLTATDAETNALTYNLIVSLPSNGHLIGTPPSLTYLPVKGLNGSDSITFNAFDGTVTGNTATVSITLVFTDSDGDGIPDSWENTHGMTNGVNDAVVDSDGDGETNYAEYMTGTDPFDPNSVLKVSEPQLTGGSNVVIKWSSVQDHFYTVQAVTNLTTGWRSLISNSVATPPLNIYTAAVNQAGPVFYRIRLDP